MSKAPLQNVKKLCITAALEKPSSTGKREQQAHSRQRNAYSQMAHNEGLTITYKPTYSTELKCTREALGSWLLKAGSSETWIKPLENALLLSPVESSIIIMKWSHECIKSTTLVFHSSVQRIDWTVKHSVHIFNLLPLPTGGQLFRSYRTTTSQSPSS